jgi:hypothetical protein
MSKRIDPEDGQAYTWEALSTYYKGKYKKSVVEAYWESCKPVKPAKGKGKGKKAAPKAEPKGKAKGKSKAKAKAKAKAKVFDYTGLEKGMKLQALEDGKYYAAEVVTVATKKNKETPVKIHWVGYTAASDEWVGGDRLKSKALKLVAGGKVSAKDIKKMIDGYKLNMGHDLTVKEEHEAYMKIADSLYKKDMATLKSIEKAICSTQSESFKYPTSFHIALKNAISKKLFQKMPPIHCTVVFALYKENNRILPKGSEEGKSHINGEDFIRRKHKQMSWLFDKKKKSSWSLLGVDDGCPMDSSGMMKTIYEGEGYDNVSVYKLKEAIKGGTLKGLNVEKLKSEAWDEGDALVKASQKAGAILYGLELASAMTFEGKRHIIVYTDSDLSTDLALCGLNFNTIIKGKAECSVSQRFGEPYSVNCGKLMGAEEGGGIAPGMPKESMIHLSLRHKLRLNLLPPLAPITDTNCGHKALTPETAAATVSKVKDYKGSFDIDWLVCVGVAAKAAGKLAIKTTPIPWVNSVGESNFWSAPTGAEDEAAKKLKSATSWHSIFKAMLDMYGWHKEELEKLGMVTDESKAYVDWVSKMDVNMYMKLSDAILESLKDKDVNMPEPSIMNMSLDDLKKLAE